ncbi:MAG TPA: murein L,D-transpeptidase catalytic domain family protein, partial [Sphingomicrobium sp.]|nr:murein L,D-transpeptidase catalytic domain family protein [Sphingomicrobium sp.]
MSLNRREMLRLGAAGAGGLLLSAAGRTQDLPGVARSPFALGNDPLRPAPAPAAPVAPSAPTGVNAGLFQRAKAALDSRPFIRQREFIGVVDFNLASADPRFHVIHVPSGHVETYRVAHGSGSDPAHSGFLDHFSNRPGSE